MAISTYSELKTAIADWMARSDISGSAADFITLGEARLNRLLDPVGTTALLTGVIGSAAIDISSLSVQEPQNVYIRSGEQEFYLTPKALGTYSTSQIPGFPSIWSIEANTIVLDRELDEAYSFRFVYLGRFALSDLAPTNEFLTNNPDLYMAASIVWGSTYIKDLPQAAMWKQLLDEFTAEVAHENAKKKRSQLTVDPALSLIGRNRYNINRDAP